MLQAEYIDNTISIVKEIIRTECPFITLSGEGYKGTIILHFYPKYDLPRVERVTSERPRYDDKGRVFLDNSKAELDEDNFMFALDIIETKLYQKPPVAGSIFFHFDNGLIVDIETKSSLMHSDLRR
ncbi:hypothetical protein [Cohnella sp. AR92]|uniref:hypothetical protein n=1 Tax=Cohnella sp. AR92 TaxID=648716 RepID=UPI000F8EF055|nr:hypothetical protein [Cohnella sp. AR92]RUS44908.1 hypothetical protein ELR57_21870 [Cohnella sp. AR92]